MRFGISVVVSGVLSGGIEGDGNEKGPAGAATVIERALNCQKDKTVHPIFCPVFQAFGWLREPSKLGADNCGVPCK